MATYGTQKVFGGTRTVRYYDPSSNGKANAFGLYQWSVFTAALGGGTASTFVPLTSVSKDAVINLLLFTSDVLALGSLADAIGVSLGRLIVVSSVPFLDETAGGADSVVPLGSVGKGYVGSVACSGFPAQVTVATANSNPPIIVTAYANSPNIASPISTLDWDNASPTSGALPVLLLASDYTAVIRDANNQIVEADGTTYQVVGLYAIVS